MSTLAKREVTVEPHRMLFAPCAEDEHSDCIGYSNGLRRDAELVVCSCECHEQDAKSHAEND